MNILKTKTLVLILTAFSTIGLQGPVFAENIPADTRWVLVGDSPLLDRSSKYLFKGNSKGGIKYALKALARSQSKYSQVIAQHNLCIAYARQGEMELAAGHCAQARNASIPDAGLKQIKPGLYKISRYKSATIELHNLIAHNLEINGLNKELHRLAQVN